MSDKIITQERLLEIAGMSPKAHRATLRKALHKAGTPFKELNGRICTTEEAITACLVGRGRDKPGHRPNLEALRAASEASKGAAR